MKKILSYLSIAITGLLMAACSDDYKDWKSQQTYDPEEAITIPGFSASATAVDLNTSEDLVKIITLNGTLPEGTTIQHIRFVPTIEGEELDEIKAADNVDMFAKSDLQNLIANTYGMRPVAREIEAHVYADMMIDGQGAYVDAGTCTLTITPKAPHISPAYYIVGGPNEWAPSAAERSIKFNHSGKDVYEDPIFTVVFDAATEGDTWFAFGDDDACDAIGDGDWSKLFGIVGGDSQAEEGRFDYRYNLGADNSFCVPAGAKKILVQIDMLSFTYSVKAVDYEEYIYEAGNNNGWGNPVDYLKGKDFDGKYVGFMYLDGEFKFRSHADSWDAPDWGAGSSDGSLAEQGSNLKADAGYYQVNADIAAMTYSLIPITTIGIVGPAQDGGWDADTDMTYNKETGAWETTIDLKADEMKFRANDGWDINWGGTADALTQGGANIKIAEAGSYFIQLFAYCDGKAYCKITKK